MAHHHQHWPVGVHLLGGAEVVDAVSGDEVRQVVLGRKEKHMNILTCTHAKKDKTSRLTVGNRNKERARGLTVVKINPTWLSLYIYITVEMVHGTVSINQLNTFLKRFYLNFNFPFIYI